MSSALYPSGFASPGVDARGVSLMIKPVGSACNLRCHYCYYLPVEGRLGSSSCRMSLGVLEEVLAGYLPWAADRVTLSFQGGEPTLAGLAWFESVVGLVERYRREGQQVAFALQTNGTLLDEAWCVFLRKHGFLVGLSLDGLASDHDAYRVMARDGGGSYHEVLRGLRLLKRHRLEHNLMVVLNDRNVVHPERVWRELMRLGIDWVQFIPAVEWLSPDEQVRVGCHDSSWTGARTEDAWEGWRLADFSPDGAAYGRFLCRVFDAWFMAERQRVSVRVFDHVLSVLIQGQATECTYASSCRGQVTIEQDGSVFGCDHYVQEDWRLGRVAEEGVTLTVDGERPDAELTGERRWMADLDGARYQRFSERKLELEGECRSCRWRALCYGGCPKHRPARGELEGPTVLCEGYRAFFEHAMPGFQWLAGFLRAGQAPPAEVPVALASRYGVRGASVKRVKRRKSRRR
ncbi:radical SAM protein [Mucisphaera sp.]|uniref:radical SAM protein n=1 Tax=Mucisphaera sp. TaxID=2913024 RepID=UPI003D0B43AD